MFTGLVEDVGTVLRVERIAADGDALDHRHGGSGSAVAGRRADAVVLEVRPERIPIGELADGDSVCHDGVCLTVTERGAHSYTVLAGAETLARTTLGRVIVGTRLNLERALRAGDRLGGHMVAGHVDGTGVIADRADNGANLVLTIAPPPALLKYIVEKGSIAVDGVSLTVNTVTADAFSVALIPHTRDHTTLGTHRVTSPVNLEVDVIAKYVEKLVAGYRGGTP